MANTVYPNEVLVSRLTDLLNTKLNTKSLMTINDALAGEDGDIIKIATYTYTATVEEVAKGSGNTEGARGSITYTTKPYTVKVSQQTFDYFDADARQDSNIVDFAMQGAAQKMVNDMNSKYFAELGKATLEQSYATSFTYDATVDGISLMNLEDESALFIIISPSLKAAIRKDSDFIAARQGEIVFNGQIGSIAGIPVIESKLLPAGEAYIASKEAVTMFTKKESEVEQARNIETSANTVVLRKINLVALTDATKVVRIAKAESGATTVVTALKDTKIVAGACPAEAHTISVYVNDVLVATGAYNPADTDAYSITIPDNLVAGDEVLVVARRAGYVSKASEAFTVQA